jgi:hypothetical protein
MGSAFLVVSELFNAQFWKTDLSLFEMELYNHGDDEVLHRGILQRHLNSLNDKTYSINSVPHLKPVFV